MKYKNPVCLFLLVSAAIPFTSLSAADDGIDQVVVTATRHERDISKIGSSVSVIDKEDIELHQYPFTVEALRNVPGVSVNQNGAFGGQATISIRGASTDQTVILIDGVQTNDPSAPGGGYNFANLDPNDIERIEILRGPQSLLYGSDAIGGVINVITKIGEAGFSGNAFIEGGSFNTLRTGGTVRGGSDAIKGSLSVSYFNTDGTSKADENNGNTEDDGYENISLAGKLVATPSDNVKLSLFGRYSDSESEFDGFIFGIGPADADERAQTTEQLVAGRAQFSLFDSRLTNTLSLEYSATDRDNFTNGLPSFNAKGNRSNIDYLGSYVATNWMTMSFGGQHEETKSENDSSMRFAIDSAFIQLEIEPVEHLTLTGGVRVDDHETFGGETTSRFTAAYNLEQSDTLFRASWGQGFKAPSVFQLTFICGFCGLTTPSTNLKPEIADGWDVGIEQSLFANKVKANVTYFYQKTENLILFTFTNGYANVDKSRTKGVEVSVDAALTDWLSLKANYTNLSAVDEITGARLIRRPKHQAFISATVTPIDKLTTTLSIIHNGAELERGGIELSEWTRADIAVEYALTDRVSLYGRVENLFDKEYQQVLGYGTPDRSAYVGLKARF